MIMWKISSCQNFLIANSKIASVCFYVKAIVQKKHNKTDNYYKEAYARKKPEQNPKNFPIQRLCFDFF